MGLLSKKEEEVAKFVMRGFTSKEIAIILNRSFRTIENLRQKSYKKLEATSYVSFINRCISLNISGIGDELIRSYLHKDLLVRLDLISQRENKSLGDIVSIILDNAINSDAFLLVKPECKRLSKSKMRPPTIKERDEAERIMAENHQRRVDNSEESHDKLLFAGFNLLNKSS